MTEFKKLKDLLHTQLTPSCDKLFADPTVAGDECSSDTAAMPIEELHALLVATHATAADGAARFLKLVAKAREKNPDKQIFNEKTSQAIIDEYNAFVAVLARFFEVGAEAAGEDEPAFVPLGGAEEAAFSNTAINAMAGGGGPKEAIAPHQLASRGSVASTAGGLSAASPGQPDAPHGAPPHLSPVEVMEARLREADDTSVPTRDTFLAWDLGPKLRGVELRFAAAVIAKAQREADHRQLLGSLQAVEEAEASGRQLLLMTEKSIFHTEIVPAAAISRREARSRQHAREEQLYMDEISRRRLETAALKGRVEADGALVNSLAAIKALLTAPEAAPSAFKTFRRNLLDLVDEVVNRPENENIRTMRTDHYRTVAAFGHPAICEARDVYLHAETVLGCVGYTVAYTKQPAHSARTPQHVAELGLPLDLPHKAAVCPITYAPLGYEAYGERLLVFQEPDPAEDAALWCDWHDRVSATTVALREALDK